MQQNWQSSEKLQHFKEKTQYLINILYMQSEKRLSFPIKMHCFSRYKNQLTPSILIETFKLIAT